MDVIRNREGAASTWEPPATVFVRQIRHGGNIIGVPVASKHKEKERHRDERWSNSDPKHSVAALFEQSGEVACVDFRQFGKRAGEIIAQATRLPHRKPN
jgi:hypothetical protein